ncbi:MAG TPA: GNAT family N-acetyltransferase [Armatimonadota bacterium]|jgi:putative acetyltransferase|nr:GNAT family N-acetyltransferase [Armatimonadota bacterium]
MNLRRATLDDVPAMVSLHARAVREVCSRDYAPEQIDNWLSKPTDERFAENVSGGLVYVCVGGAGDVMGFGERRADSIASLYVNPDHHRRGVASLILRKLESDARAAGKPELLTHSTVTALGLYEKHGYENLGEVTCHASRQIPLEAYRVRKRL